MKDQKDGFPFKLSPIGWILFLTVLIASFYIYYTQFYGIISNFHQEKMWSGTRAHFQDENDVISLRINAPKTIADFTDSEIRVQAWNNGFSDRSLKFVVDAQIYDTALASQLKAEHLESCNVIDTDQPFVYVSNISSFSKEEVKKETFGTSAFLLNVPPHGSANTSLWIVLHLNSSLRDNACIVIRLFEILDSTSQTDVSNCEIDESSQVAVCPVSFDENPGGEFVVRFNREESLYRYVIENFLVPPWLNIIILFFAWLFSWFLDNLVVGPRNASE